MFQPCIFNPSMSLSCRGRVILVYSSVVYRISLAASPSSTATTNFSSLSRPRLPEHLGRRWRPYQHFQWPYP